MSIWRNLLVLITIFAGLCIPAEAQIVIPEHSDKEIADSIRKELDSRPYFSLYKDTVQDLNSRICLYCLLNNGDGILKF